MGMTDDRGYSLVPMETMGSAQQNNGGLGGYSPPSDGEGVANHIMSDDEL